MKAHEAPGDERDDTVGACSCLSRIDRAFSGLRHNSELKLEEAQALKNLENL